MTFYSNPEYDKIVEEQANTDDGAKRLELITEALKIEAEDVPRINLFYMISNIAHNKDLNCKVCPAMESYNWSEFSGIKYHRCYPVGRGHSRGINCCVLFWRISLNGMLNRDSLW